MNSIESKTMGRRTAPYRPEGAVLAVEHLGVSFHTQAGEHTVLDDVSFSVGKGQTVALVGESGSGKSISCLALMGLLPGGISRITGGSALLYSDGASAPTDLLGLTRRQRTEVSGRRVSMIFQEPMSSLNPALTVGEQIGEVLRRHRGLSRIAAKARAVDLLDMVGIAGASRRVRDYPHAFSGGMRQRVMIASALAADPDLLIADEPTTALDVTVQEQILDLLRSMQDDFGMSILFVTHDLGVVADCADEVVVLYAGQVVEQAPVQTLFDYPKHPYTEGLLASLPQLGTVDGRLPSIPGNVPAPRELTKGCRFRNRCPYATAECANLDVVPLEDYAGGTVRCLRAHDLSLEGVEDAN